MPEENPNNEETTGEENSPGEEEEKTSFPTGMLCLAIVFDLVGMIPLLNLATEPLAGLIFGFWQTQYSPKTDPVITWIVSKIIDLFFLGFFPSNMSVVIFAYLKKKTAQKLASDKKLAEQSEIEASFWMKHGSTYYKI